MRPEECPPGTEEMAIDEYIVPDAWARLCQHPEKKKELVADVFSRHFDYAREYGWTARETQTHTDPDGGGIITTRCTPAPASYSLTGVACVCGAKR